MSTSPAAVKAPPITVEQYEGFRGYPGLRDELIYGEIVMSPFAKPLHQEIAKNVERILDGILKGSQYRTVRESNVNFPALNSMPGPDVYVITREALREAIEKDIYISEPPVLVVEVLSPANRPKRVAQKIEIYLTSGVGEVWSIDPKKRTLVVNRAKYEQVFQVGDRIGLQDPLPAAAIVIADIFRIDI
jgi:Uma2 family endonuclease